MARRRKQDEFRPLRIHQALAQRLGRAILSGEFGPGYGFGSEVEEAEAYGVSRTVYRDALRILVAKGLLESRPKTGSHVTPRKRWNKLDPDILEWMFLDEPTRESVRDLFELRSLIEPPAAALAAQRRTPEQLAEMDRSLELMGRHGLKSSEGQAADRDFHAAVLSATSNEMLQSLSSSIGAAVHWTTHFKQRKGRIARDSLPEHIALRDAIAASDAEAARLAMQRLVDQSLADMGD